LPKNDATNNWKPTSNKLEDTEAEKQHNFEDILGYLATFCYAAL
jgi:hypothetical protein